jgi:hypothetical protein
MAGLFPPHFHLGQNLLNEELVLLAKGFLGIATKGFFSGKGFSGNFFSGSLTSAMMIFFN